MTPGIVFGRFQLIDRLKFIVRADYQMAASPTVPTYRNNLIVTTRLPF